MKKIVSIVMIMVIGMLALTGCGNESVEGTWTEVKQVDSDGKVRKAEDLPVTETFVISGDEAKDTLHFIDGSSKDITVTYTLEKKSDTEYLLKVGDSFDYTTFTIDGDQFKFRLEDTEDKSSYTDYYFKKKK